MSYSDELGKLADLHQRGAITDEEFARAKAQVLGASPRPNPRPAATEAIHSFRRSRDDRWLGGVCGGLGTLTDIPSWIWRIFFILLLMCGGSGILAYLLLWIFVPSETTYVRASEPHY